MTIEDEQRQYVRGQRMAWKQMLDECLKNLEPQIGGAGTSPVQRVAILTSHLEETRAMLRRVCGEHGDLDWADDLHLADVVDKHLSVHLTRSNNAADLLRAVKETLIDARGNIGRCGEAAPIMGWLDEGRAFLQQAITDLEEHNEDSTPPDSSKRFYE
jgi:hypothetical protein